jgi:hypothetical protein
MQLAGYRNLAETGRRGMTAKAKGDILEDLVALMHEMPGVFVEKRVKLPVLQAGRKRRREVDVLITSNVAGYDVRLAIGCKNEIKALDMNAIDNFVGILTDVGIPLQYGILVSANGYTRDALDAARQRGIRTLVYEGLSADRLSIEISAALNSIVYLLVTQSNLSILPYVEISVGDDSRFITATLHSKGEPSTIQVMTSLWELWVSQQIPASIGNHTVCLKPKNPESKWRVIGDVTVTGLIASLPGTFSRGILRDAAAGTIERVQISAKFDEIKGPLMLTPVSSEKDLDEVVIKEKLTIVTRVRVPRIVSNAGYWPPSAQALKKAKALLDAGKPIAFEHIESSNIADAWPSEKGRNK